MKILFCSEGLLIDGVASFNLYLSAALRKAGNEVAIAGRWSGFKSFKSRHKEHGVNVIDGFSLTPISRNLVSRSLDFDPDMIITDARRAFPLALEIKKRSRAKLVTVFHDEIRDDPRKERSLDTIIRFSDGWATSEGPILDQMKKLGTGLPLALIHRPITGMVHPTPLPPRDPFRVLSLGRLSGYKSPGHLSLLNHVGALKKAIPSLEITFVGGGDRTPLFRFKALKENLKAGSTYVRVAGSVTNPNDWLKWSTIVCAGATSAAEAVLSNRPTIAFSGYWMGLIGPDNIEQGISWHFGERAGHFRMKHYLGITSETLIDIYSKWDQEQVEQNTRETRMALAKEFDSEEIAGQFMAFFANLK